MASPGARRPPRAPRLGPAPLPPRATALTKIGPGGRPQGGGGGGGGTDDAAAAASPTLTTRVVSPYWAFFRGRWTQNNIATGATSTVISLYMPRDDELASRGVPNAAAVGHTVYPPFGDGRTAYLWGIDTFTYDVPVPRYPPTAAIERLAAVAAAAASPPLSPVAHLPPRDYVASVVPGVELKRSVAVFNMSSSPREPGDGVRVSVVLEVGSGYVFEAQGVRLEPHVSAWWHGRAKPRRFGAFPRHNAPLPLPACEPLARVTRAPHNSHGFVVLHNTGSGAGAAAAAVARYHVLLDTPRLKQDALLASCTTPLASVVDTLPPSATRPPSPFMLDTPSP